MSFTRIKNSDFTGNRVSELPNVPTIGATELKAKFDAPSINVMMPKVNELMEQLESSGASSNLGIVAPDGTGGTIQEVVNEISETLSDVESVAHSHGNKDDCLDFLSDHNGSLYYKDNPIGGGGGGGSYTPGDGISVANNIISAKLDSATMEFSGGNIKAKNSHTHSNKNLLDTYTQTESNLSDAVSKKHSHTNKTQLDKIGETGGKMTYNGNPVGVVQGAFKTVSANGVSIVASGEDSLEFSAGTNVQITANASGKSITISATGGGGGGSVGVVDGLTSTSTTDALSANQGRVLKGYVDAINQNATDIHSFGDVETALSDKATLVHTHTVSDVTDFPSLSTVATTGNYSDLNGTPSLAQVATSGDYSDLSNTPSLATVATSGSYSDLSNTPTIPTALSDLTDDSTHRFVSDTDKTNWNGKVDSVSVSRTGTASSSVTSAQFISVADAGGSAVTYEINGSKYMEITNTSATNYVFSNSAITSDSTIDVYTNTWGDNPSNVVATNGSCTVTFANATTRNVRIYLK